MLIEEFCGSHKSEFFADVYSAIEEIRMAKLRKAALQSAIAAILARDGGTAVDPDKYNEIIKKISGITKNKGKREVNNYDPEGKIADMYKETIGTISRHLKNKRKGEVKNGGPKGEILKNR